jgi:hypothetical protein
MELRGWLDSMNTVLQTSLSAFERNPRIDIQDKGRVLLRHVPWSVGLHYQVSQAETCI